MTVIYITAGCSVNFIHPGSGWFILHPVLVYKNYWNFNMRGGLRITTHCSILEEDLRG